jgi:hypothetical protein
MFDDFCIDEDTEVLYLTTHRQNTIDRVSMKPAYNSGFTQSVAGDPYTEEMIGPTSGIWGEALANLAVWPISSRMVAHGAPVSSWTDTGEYRGEIRRDAEKILKELGANTTN